MRSLNLALALLGTLTLALSLGAAVLRTRWYLPSEPLLAAAFGVAIGRYGLGLFGPIGIAAVFYATVALRETGLAVVWPAVSLLVVGSLLAHGASATLLTTVYGGLEDDAG